MYVCVCVYLVLPQSKQEAIMQEVVTLSRVQIMRSKAFAKNAQRQVPPIPEQGVLKAFCPPVQGLFASRHGLEHAFEQRAVEVVAVWVCGE